MPLQNDHLKKDDFLVWTPDGSGKILHDDSGYEDHLIRADRIVSGYPALHCGSIPDPENFSRNEGHEGYFDINAFLIKEAGSNDYKIPARAAPYVAGFIKAAAADQHARNPLAVMKHAVFYYRRSHVFYEYGQVAAQWHVDDIQTALSYNSSLKDHAFPPAYDISMQAYIASNIAGTMVQSRAVRDALTMFNNKAGVSNIDLQKQNARVTDPHEIVAINNYTHHRATALSATWAKTVGQSDLILSKLLDPTGGIRCFAGILYIPTEPMRGKLGQHQKVRFETRLEW